MLRNIARASLLASTLLAFTPTLSTAGEPSYYPGMVNLGDCYYVKFVGFYYDDYGNSIWKYRVKEKYGCPDLSNWVISLPNCKVKWAKPEPWEKVVDESNTHLTGIKFQTGAGFKYGTFKFKLKGQPSLGVIEVAAKGPDVFFGEIVGPVCQDYSDYS